MYPDDHFFRHNYLAEEATANLELPWIVGTGVSEIDHAGLANAVNAIQVMLRSPAQAAQAGSVAPDIVPSLFEALEGIAVYFHSRLA